MVRQDIRPTFEGICLLVMHTFLVEIEGSSLRICLAKPTLKLNLAELAFISEYPT